MPQVTVRSAAESDLDAIAAIAIATGQREEWSGSNPAYVRHLMQHGSVVVAASGEQLAGFGAVQELGTGPAAVTMLCDLFVDPAAHGAGYGRAMLARLWQGATRRMTFSSMHSHAIPLYTSFGLDAWWPLLYLMGDPATLAMPPGWIIDRVSANVAAEYEREWTAIDRSADHRAWVARPNGSSLLARHDGEVLAAGTVAGSGDEYGIVHLAVSAEADDGAAAAAVLAALAGLEPPGKIAHLCLPGPHPAVRPLLAAGWRVQELDQFMASEPEVLNPRRAVPSPGQA